LVSGGLDGYRAVFCSGSVKNVYARALWMPIQPLIIRYTSPDKYQQLVVSMDPEKMADVNVFMEKKWKETFPNTQYNGQMIDQELQETNDINKNVVIMFASSFLCRVDDGNWIVYAGVTQYCKTNEGNRGAKSTRGVRFKYRRRYQPGIRYQPWDYNYHR